MSDSTSLAGPDAPVATEGDSEPRSEADRISRERRRLLRFLLRLGHLMLATGSPVRLVETTLQRIAAVHKIAQFNVLALPTVLFVNFAEEDDVLQIEFTAEQGLVLRFDQIEATFELARDAARAALDPTDGLRRINAILAMPPRYRWQW
ncbi:MAG TPA: threonine/serine exporter family protein, partial [Ramlibacter sp.]